MSLTVKEKELANIGASVATGCKPCTDFHFEKVRQAGATDEEIKQAISYAMIVRDSAREIMESHGLQHLGLAKEAEATGPMESTTRIKELVSIAAAFAVNCTTNLEKHMAAARAIDISEEEIESVLDAALFIKGEAAYYVDQIVTLKKKSDELQQLLDELKATQAQLVQSEKMAGLGKLVAGFVHELNNPIGAIKAAVDVSMRSISKIKETISSHPELNEIKSGRQLLKSLEHLNKNNEVTISATDRIASITDSLKSFARIDESMFQKACIHEGLESTLALLEHEFKDRIEIVKEFGDIPYIYCYPGDLNQVFMHLLTNAVKAIRGKGRITVRTFVKKNHVHIEIKDNGIGILPDLMEGIFDPSFSKDGSRVKAGLGLFTSYNIVQSHKGRIKVESDVGKGSTFTVIIPVDLDKKSIAKEEAGAESADHRCEQMTHRCDRLKT